MALRIIISWWVNYNLIKLKRSGRYVASRVEYDINSLKDPFIAQQFSVTTRNKYQALQDMQDPRDTIDTL